MSSLKRIEFQHRVTNNNETVKKYIHLRRKKKKTTEIRIQFCTYETHAHTRTDTLRHVQVDISQLDSKVKGIYSKFSFSVSVAPHDLNGATFSSN